MNWDSIGDGFDSMALPIICLAGSVWLDTQSEYHWIDDTPTTTTTTKTYHTLIIWWYSTQEERHSTVGIELESASKTDSMALPIGWQLVVEYLYCGIDDTDTPTEKAYQLDEGVSN